MNQMTELIERICQTHQEVLSPDQQALLRAAARRALRSTTLVAFGGHFKSGKSTLLNAALGRNILPVDDLPETGAICRVGLGAKDALTVHTGSREQFNVPCTTEAIRSYCSIVSGRGTRRQEVDAVQALEIRLQGVPMPDNVRWLDTPGINDHPEMDLRAAQAAGAADTLVWVLTSRQPLSEPEESFLANHIETHGPWSVVFVLNSFLRSETQEAWEAFHSRNLPTIHAKLRYFLEGMVEDPGLVAVCARDAATRPGRGFGSQQLECVVREISQPANQNVLNTRSFQVARAAQTVIQQLAEPLAQAESHHAAAAAAARQAAGKELARWERDVQEAMEAYLQALAPAASRCADQVCEQIQAKLIDDDTHCDYLNGLLAVEMGQLAGQLRSSLRSAKQKLHHGRVDLAGLQGLRDVPRAEFNVWDAALSGKNCEKAAKCGAAAGFATGGPLGALVVGAGAALVGHLADRWDHYTSRVNCTQNSARAAADEVCATLTRRGTEIRDQLLSALQTEGPPGGKEHRQAERLRKAVQDLEALRSHATRQICPNGTAQVVHGG